MYVYLFQINTYLNLNLYLNIFYIFMNSSWSEKRSILESWHLSCSILLFCSVFNYGKLNYQGLEQNWKYYTRLWSFSFSNTRSIILSDNNFQSIITKKIIFRASLLYNRIHKPQKYERFQLVRYSKEWICFHSAIRY